MYNTSFMLFDARPWYPHVLTLYELSLTIIYCNYYLLDFFIIYN